MEKSRSHTNLFPCFMSRLSPEERAQVAAQLDELTDTYSQLCDSSSQQLQQLEQQLAKEEERKVESTEGLITNWKGKVLRAEGTDAHRDTGLSRSNLLLWHTHPLLIDSCPNHITVILICYFAALMWHLCLCICIKTIGAIPAS